ncbi:unnamed protein product, partial [Adineta steineri]
LSFNQPKLGSTPIWDSNGITSANRSIVGEYPCAIFVNTNNTIYVANRENNTIVMWQEEGSNPIKIIHGNFSNSASLFVTSNGDIYIDDGYDNGQVQKWIAETNTFATVMNVNSSCDSLFVNINSTLYCSMFDHHQVVKTSLNDTLMTSNRVAAGTGIEGSDSNQLAGPFGIFVDVNSDLYVTDCGNHRVQLFQLEESNGITVAGSTSLNPTITLVRPTGITLDAEKYLFIVDNNNHRIVGSGLTGFRCLVGCYGIGSQSNQLNKPFSLSFDHSGNMFITDQLNSRIQKFLLMKDSFALSFNQLKFCSTATWNPNGITTANQSIVGKNPLAIFVNTNNTIYAINQQNNTIIMWEEESVNPTKIIHDNFSNSASLFVTSKGDIYIDDGYGNGQVQRWIAGTTTFVTVMNVSSSCFGLFVDINDTLYCSMFNHDQVLKTSLNDSVMSSNRIIAGTGSPGPASNQLAGPGGIFVDMNLDLYVTDCRNDRVQLFLSEESNGITVAGSTSLNPTITLRCPNGITLDAEKYLFIVDSNNDRIVGSGVNGFRCLVGCYGWGSQSNQMNKPFSFSFDHFGNIFVTDQGNSRIQKFQYFEESCDSSLLVKSMYLSSLTPNSSIYFQDCSEFDSYYEEIQMNVNITGYYTFQVNSTMKTMYAYIYTNNFNPFNVSKNILSKNGDSRNQSQYQLTAVLEANMKYVFVVTTSASNVTGNVSIEVSGRSYIDFNSISYPSVIEIPYSSAVQSNYSSELNTSSQTYSRDCRKSNYYYQTIRMNVVETGYYALSSNSSMDTFGDIYKDDFNPMNPFENLLSQDYRACSSQDFKFIAYLYTGTTYILVVTTSSSNTTGNFSILTSGPDNITLDPYTRALTSCFIGQKCQFYKKSIGVTLDDILRDEIRPNMTVADQTVLMKINAATTMIMFVGGLINSLLSILTFQNKDLRQVGCGIYLLASSITSFLTISMFTVKF